MTKFQHFVFVCILLSTCSTLAIMNGLNCTSMDIISRAEWNLGGNETNATKILRPNQSVNYIVIHHTATEECKKEEECIKIIQDLYKIHADFLKMKDVGPHFFVGGDDRVYEGRGWGVENEDVIGCSTCLSIAFIGNYEEAIPTASILDAGLRLIECGLKKKMIYSRYSIYGHRDLRCTTCPGENLYQSIKSWRNYAFAGEATKICD